MAGPWLDRRGCSAGRPLQPNRPTHPSHPPPTPTCPLWLAWPHCGMRVIKLAAEKLKINTDNSSL